MAGRSDPVVVAAGVFLERFGDDAGKRLESILPHIGLDLKTRDAKSYEGCLLRIKGIPRGRIVLSEQIREAGRRRFTLAHEVGHYLLPNQQDLSAPCTKVSIESWDDALAKPETDANRFAAEVLMPRSIVQAYLREMPKFKHIEEIAKSCDTSLTASAYRLAELSSFRVAAVWSHAGSVRWYKPSQEFERWIRKGEVRPESFAFDAFRGEPVPTSLESVPATAWLFEKGLRNDARILEQSVLLPNYDAVLTWLVIPEEIEDWDDSAARELDPDEFTLHRKVWPAKK
jgi:hypothetical protein